MKEPIGICLFFVGILIAMGADEIPGTIKPLWQIAATGGAGVLMMFAGVKLSKSE